MKMLLDHCSAEGDILSKTARNGTIIITKSWALLLSPGKAVTVNVRISLVTAAHASPAPNLIARRVQTSIRAIVLRSSQYINLVL